MFFYSVPLISAGSIIYLYFPTDYPSNTLQNYSCLPFNGFSPNVSLSCNIQYRILKIMNGFPVSVNSSYLELGVLLINIKNPMYSITTQTFSGNLTDSLGNNIAIITAYSGGTLTITPGNLRNKN